MSTYDRQAVVVLLDGTEHDATALKAASNLIAKSRAKALESSECDVPPAATVGGPWRAVLASQLGQLTSRSRLYLVSAGGDGSTLAGWSASAVADLLAESGMPPVKVVSIVADYAGGATAEQGANHGAPTDSFAARFHRRLRDAHKIETMVLARTCPVVVLDSNAGNHRGRKVTADEIGNLAHHRSKSKVRLTWADNSQVQEWVEYESPHAAEDRNG